MHHLNLLGLSSECRVNGGFKESCVRNILNVIDAESFKQTIDLHDDVWVWIVLVVLLAPIIDLSQNF